MQYAGLAAVLLLAFVSTYGTPQHRQDAQKTAAQYIGVVVPYQPAKAEPAPPGPVKAAELHAPQSPDPESPATCRTGVSHPNTARGVAPKPIRPAMLSYVVHTDPPKPSTASPPAAPAQTGLTFKASDLAGLKASPAIDDTYMLMPGLLPCVLDTAIQSDLPGPCCATSPGRSTAPRACC